MSRSLIWSMAGLAAASVRMPAHATIVDTKLSVLSTVGVDSAATWRWSW